VSGTVYGIEGLKNTIKSIFNTFTRDLNSESLLTARNFEGMPEFSHHVE
jgi:hypothetical protein